MAKARAPTAVIRRDMFVVILGLVGAVGQRQSGQLGLITLIQTLTLVWPRATEQHGQAPDTLIMRTIFQKYLGSGEEQLWSRFRSGTPRSLHLAC